MKNLKKQETCKDMELPEEPEKPDVEYTKEEQCWIAFGALKAGLMIGAVYLIGLGLVIWLLLAVWT